MRLLQRKLPTKRSIRSVYHMQKSSSNRLRCRAANCHMARATQRRRRHRKQNQFRRDSIRKCAKHRLAARIVQCIHRRHRDRPAWSRNKLSDRESITYRFKSLPVMATSQGRACPPLNTRFGHNCRANRRWIQTFRTPPPPNRP